MNAERDVFVRGWVDADDIVFVISWRVNLVATAFELSRIRLLK